MSYNKLKQVHRLVNPFCATAALVNVNKNDDPLNFKGYHILL